MVKLTIKLLIVAAILHAGYRVVPVFYAHYKCKDALNELATFSTRKTTDEILERAVKIAKEHDLPLDKQDITVSRTRQVTSINARYGVKLEYLPRQYYPYEFVIDIRAAPRFAEYTP